MDNRPVIMQGNTYTSHKIETRDLYNMSQREGFEKLYWRLRGVTKTQESPLGNLKPLPKKE